MDISDRLFEAMKEAGFPSQSALSRASGIPQPTINRILNRIGVRGPELNTLKALAETCNVSLQWLQEGVEPKGRGTVSTSASTFSAVEAWDDADPRWVQVKFVTALRLSAGISGAPADFEPDSNSTIPLDPRWVERNKLDPRALVATRVRGESMEPTLYDDDLIVINTADKKPIDGSVFAVNYEGEAVVKRLVRDAGEWWLESDNPDRRYGRKICRGDACVIVGRVVRKESDRL